MRKYLSICIGISILLLSACQTGSKGSLSLDERPVYPVRKSTVAPMIDGKLDDAAWDHANVETLEHFYFTDPKQEQPTQLRMLWSTTHLYVAFEMKDAYLNAVETQRDGAPYLDDCAELFLIPSPTPENVHICWEINPLKAVNDLVYVNDFYQGKNAPIRAFNPSIDFEVSVKGTLNDNSDVDEGWVLEMAIPLTVFRGFDEYHPVQTGTKWAFLAIKQIRDNDEVGPRKMVTNFPVDNIKEGVHQPNMFGLLEFVE